MKNLFRLPLYLPIWPKERGNTPERWVPENYKLADNNHQFTFYPETNGP